MQNADIGAKRKMRMPGIEPGSQAWEACMILLHYMRLATDLITGASWPDIVDSVTPGWLCSAPLRKPRSRKTIDVMLDKPKQTISAREEKALRLP
jgi:hypothetical protein